MKRRKNQLIISRAKLDWEDIRVVCNYCFLDGSPNISPRADYIVEGNCLIVVGVKVRGRRRMVL